MAKSTGLVAWCVAALFGLMAMLPLVHATSHCHAVVVATAAGQTHHPIETPGHEEDDTDQCDACLTLALGKHFGIDPVIRPSPLIFTRAIAEEAVPVVEVVVVRHMLPPPSRGPPELI